MAQLTINSKVTPYKIPISVFLSWPPINFRDPERRHGFVPYAAVLQSITSIVIFARLCARYTRRAGSFGLDDALIIVGWVFGTAFTALAIHSVVNLGFDRHIWDVPAKLRAEGGLIAWLMELMFLLSNCSTKISILLFHRRIIPINYSRRLVLAIYAAIIFTVLYFFAFTFILIFGCNPIESTWKSFDMTYSVPYTCVDQTIIAPMVGGLSVFSDLYTLGLPAIALRKLRVEKRKKIILYCIFGCGSLVVGAGIARAVWFVRIILDKRHDLSWVAYDVFIWSLLEEHLAIICSSAPALKALFETIPWSTQKTSSESPSSRLEFSTTDKP